MPRVIEGEQRFRLAQRAGAVQARFFVGKDQPGADVLGQNHHRTLVEQAGLACVLQRGVELQVQALRALIITGLQGRADGQQITLIGRRASGFDDFAAQVGQVVAARYFPRPQRVDERAAEQQGGEEGGQQGTHRKTGDGIRPQGKELRRQSQVALLVLINNLSLTIIERSRAALYRLPHNRSQSA